MLQAMGINNLTPFAFQADIMNGVDPSPQDISLENSFFTQHKVKVFCYNQQVVDSLTTSIRQTALKAGVPVVGVYETMPTPGYDYQSWMLAEVHAIEKAIDGQDLDREAVMTGQYARIQRRGGAGGAARRRGQRVAVGRQILDDVSFTVGRASSPVSSARTGRARPRCSG